VITVMGASGKTGKAAAEQLLQAGEKVRVLGRSAEPLKALAAKGAEIVTGDATDAAHLSRAFKGADAVYVLVPPSLDAPDVRAHQDRVSAAIEAAIKESGVKHVVLLSSIGAEVPAGTGPVVGLHFLEERLKKLSGVNVLALRPGYFMENLFGSLGMIKHLGINGGAIGPDVPITMIATRDIGAVAAEALRKRDFKGFTVRELRGERDLTFAEATKILGERIGKPDLKYVQFPYPDFTAALVKAGIGFEAVADALAGAYKAL
jgi:uncharacterized protein YbjT (DUF2867 family)